MERSGGCIIKTIRGLANLKAGNIMQKNDSTSCCCRINLCYLCWLLPVYFTSMRWWTDPPACALKFPSGQNKPSRRKIYNNRRIYSRRPTATGHFWLCDTFIVVAVSVFLSRRQIESRSVTTGDYGRNDWWWGGHHPISAEQQHQLPCGCALYGWRERNNGNHWIWIRNEWARLKEMSGNVHPKGLKPQIAVAR